jgi:putative redox protein
VGSTEIRIEASIDADLTEAEKNAFLDQVCQRCPLHDNVKLASSVVHRLA